MYFDLAFGGLDFLWSVWSEFLAVGGSSSRFLAGLENTGGAGRASIMMILAVGSSSVSVKTWWHLCLEAFSVVLDKPEKFSAG